ncbi:MAG: GIY-YIG nuclease family protein [Deltaproteobacteria bacterium]|nr:GIY-YIG nuclease family protein [Deltaproteobacteria bacterium]
MVTLYVLKAKTGRRYVGITNNLSRRLREHRKKVTKGGQILGDFLDSTPKNFQITRWQGNERNF